MDTRSSKTEFWAVRAAVAAVLGSALMVPSYVLAAEAEEDEEDVELSEVQVTGTRIQVAGNYSAANPMTTITAEEMRQLGMVNVADALQQLVPQNVSTYTDFSVSDGRETTLDGADRSSYFIGNTIANLRGLDPAFGSRTLTMIDGRRVVSTSNQADVVDMNIIPSNLLQRMDVVTGGASATYGSGAMAGVVNLVLNNRLDGFNVDVDYGVNEAGDGGSPHFAISGGQPLFGGRAHVLVGLEWQKTDAIQDCAAARNWCAESRGLFENPPQFNPNPAAVLTGQLPGFTDGTYPARFQMSNLRYSQFSSEGVVYSTNVNNTSGFRFTPDGTDVEEYAFGYRGGAGSSDVMNGDGPLSTSGISMRSGNERRSLFTNFEFDFTQRTTGYVQASYAKTDNTNRNTYTSSTNCVRFNTPGVAAVAGAQLAAGAVIPLPAAGVPGDSPLQNANFRAFLGIGSAPGGFGVPYWYSQGVLAGFTQSAGPPTFTFAGNAVGTWESFQGGTNLFWRLASITITNPAGFNDPGTPAVLPTTGRNSYAFLNDLTPEALEQVQRGFNNSQSSGPGPSFLVGGSPCAGNTAIRKLWSPQFQRFTEQESETSRIVLGTRGRFGRDWKWDAYYQYGETDSSSVQNNAATSIRQYFAMDAVIDDRVGSATFGQPICRVTRDGPPLLDTSGRPLSDAAGIQALASGCQPLNIFGSQYTDPAAAALQEAAIDYAFVENPSAGFNSLQTLALNTSGTIWQGWAGPLTGAFGFELRENKLDNEGSLGAVYERFDITGGWSDKFGGRTRVGEIYTELNMPLISGMPGINLWSINGAVRYAKNYNKGMAGTTGESNTQDTANWKFSTVFEPFDWVRLRLTRSRDLRAPGYRDLFINQPSPGGPDFLQGANPWRERTLESTENQEERWGTLTVGNPNLTPETSDTLTVGMVLSPGGWAQGMRLSVDYYNIKVKDGIYVSYQAANPINTCWEASGNRGQGVTPDGFPDPDAQGINGLFDESIAICREITFATNEDGSRNLNDILSYNGSRPSNSLPFQRRGLDLSWTYFMPANRIVESLPGSLSLTVRGQRALESSGSENTVNFFGANGLEDVTLTYDLVGQIRSSRYIPGVTATPKWTGNIITSYLLGDFTGSLSARYIGGAALDKTWGDSPDDANYISPTGQFLNGSVDNNYAKQYFNFALNGSYNLKVANLKQFQVFGSINNLFDKSPPFTGGYVSGANPQFHDTMGRAYRMGVRMRF